MYICTYNEGRERGAKEITQWAPSELDMLDGKSRTLPGAGCPELAMAAGKPRGWEVRPMQRTQREAGAEAGPHRSAWGVEDVSLAGCTHLGVF